MYEFSIRDPHFLPHCGCEIDIRAEKGDFITLVGENGVGKSTLASRIYRELPGNASFIQQQPIDVFYDRPLRIIKNIFLSSRKEISQDVFLKLWKSFNLENKEERFQSALSGGEGQALKLCLGLSIDKEVYILDEPSQFLDASSKEKLHEVLSDFSHLKKTIIMIEHDLTWVKGPMKVKELSIQANTLRERSSWTT